MWKIEELLNRNLRILWYVVFSVILVLGCEFGVCIGVKNISIAVRKGLPDIGWDACTRRNEVVLAHKRINSYHVWTGTKKVKGFLPLAVSDKTVPENIDGNVVHAYPPWEACFFWFSGWLSQNSYLMVMYILVGVCLVVILSEMRDYLTEVPVGDPYLGLLGVMSILSSSFIYCCYTMNFGIFILTAALVMLALLKRRRYFAAGICWAFMMIKPQLGVLFFWPLFWGRYYKTLATAICMCTLGTLLMALNYGEAPWDLILQIPKYGTPFASTGPFMVVVKLIEPLFGGASIFLWMAICFGLCGILCYFTRNSNDFYVKCLPVATLIPFWTYSMLYDRMILAIWYVVVARKVLCGTNIRNKSGKLVVCFNIYILATLFISCWGFLQRTDLFNPAGLGWICRSAMLAESVCQMFMFMLIIGDYVHTKRISTVVPFRQ